MDHAPAPNDVRKPAAGLRPLQFGFPWLLAFTLLCALLLLALTRAPKDHFVLIASASIASFLLALGVASLRVLAVERTQALEARQRCKHTAPAHRGAGDAITPELVDEKARLQPPPMDSPSSARRAR